MNIYTTKIYFIFCYKIVLDSFFLLYEEPFFNFFFFFVQKFTKSLFFFKLIGLKKKYVYNFAGHPLRLAGQKIALDVFNQVENDMGGKLEFQSGISDEVTGFFEDEDEVVHSLQPSMFSIQKTFLMYKKQAIKQFISFFKFKSLRRRNLFNFFSSFRTACVNDLTTFFSLNFLKLLNRIFPFFNFFFLKLMVTRGLILINFKKVTTNFCSLRVGDFVSFFIINNVWNLIKSAQATQDKHLEKIKAKLFNFYKASDFNNLKTKSSYVSKHFSSLTVFFRKQPAWVEVDYLSFSFFIIKKSSFLSFLFYFNPFLYRLLEFK